MSQFTTFSPPGKPHIVCHGEYEQGSDQWLQARCGMLTASEVKLILTPTLKVADNDKSRAHLWELLAQRITQYVEPHFISDDMMRGHADEVDARILYSEKYAEATTDVAFMTNNRFGFCIGYSPDGIIGDDGLIECKSRRQKFQAQTIAEQAVPLEYALQLQTALLVSEREWIDFVSYSGGMPMYVHRVYPDAETQEAIVAAAAKFEAQIIEKRAAYDGIASCFHPTERRIEQEMFA
jgi:predicted phage-related endonuclease